MIEPLIKCEHVDFGYENQDAVVDVNMEVCPGDYLCIVGENGSGKSTLMKGLLGLLKPSAGVLTVSEELKHTGIGYLPQQTAAQKDFPASVQEVVLSGCLNRRGRRPFYSRTEKAVAAENMERLGIMPLAKLPGAFRRAAAESSDCKGVVCYHPAFDPGRAYYGTGSHGDPGLLCHDKKVKPRGWGGDPYGIP